MGTLCVEETRKPSVRELCGKAFKKTPVTTERRARGCASFWGFYRQESVAVGASRGLITQRSLVQIQPPQPNKIKGLRLMPQPLLGFRPKGRHHTVAERRRPRTTEMK